MNIKIGDFVKVLDEDRKGKVIRKNRNCITILDSTTDLEFRYLEDGLVKIHQEQSELQEMDNAHLFLDKRHSDSQIFPKTSKKPTKKKRQSAILRVDLHIEKIVPHYKSMPNYEKLNRQLEVAMQKIRWAQERKMNEIILIHGVGAGVLKKALEKLLTEKGFEHSPENLHYRNGAMRVLLKKLSDLN